MKKFLLAVALIIGATSASNAQIKEGNVMVGGNIANLDINFKHNTQLSLSPKAAWFIKDGLAVGAYGNMGLNHKNGANTTYTYGVGPMARYYAAKQGIKSGTAMFFVEGNAGFQGTSTTRIDDVKGTGGSTNGLGFGVGPGLTWFVTPSIGLEALLKYDGIVGFGSETYNNGLNFAIGFQIYLPGKKLAKQIKNI